MTYDEGKHMADSLKIKFSETSAKSSQNVDNSIITLAEEINSKFEKNEEILS